VILAKRAQKEIILHIAGADLEDIHVIGHHPDL
jgi:hypothetical protein